MSVFLYRLGGVIARARGLVVGVWLLVLCAVVGAAGLLGPHYDDSFTIPGTESQQGQDVLADRFGLTGTNAQILYTSTKGRLDADPAAKTLGAAINAVNALSGVAVSNPLTADDPLLSEDKRSTLAQVRFSSKVPSDATLDSVLDKAQPPPGSGVTASVGGDAYKSTADPSKVPELLGLLVSFFILAITFGSLLAAGMPILSSLIGVGITLSAAVVATSVMTVSSSAPTLAEMLGLAVGIDYALFLLSRHRQHLGEGLSPTESMSRALATAGSAVVFAGATVIIALLGLTVARIPVLTIMGVTAAVAVSMAVSVALTLVPAVALLLGTRLRPRPRTQGRLARRLRRRRARASTRDVVAASPRTPEAEASGRGRGLGSVWIRVVTAHPVLTVLLVLGALTTAAMPASDMNLALPDNSTAPASSTQRQTYDAITTAFGEGYNAPLSMTANVITSSDPKSTVSKLSKAVADVPGVVAVTQATPNSAGDTALVVAIPPAGQTSARTSALVQALRGRAPGWEKQYDVQPIYVSGQTAINIDVSERLAGALLPFAAIVIGLSLLLLMVVFRSVAVPVKATLGYLLSVGAALGAVVAAFQWGWLEGALDVTPGPIVSFLPIFVMGVLFGLAMDYEMFLVSAMREAYVRSGDAKGAVLVGFRASSRVVAAAALIMTSVFVAFIPDGSSTIKPIALGLAVGVFVDAFLVRMTLVPAVLVLLGARAWWLPGWLERRLPVVDVEGAALHHMIAFRRWEHEHGPTALLAQDLVVRDGGRPVAVTAPPGQVTWVGVPPGEAVDRVGQALVGRGPAVGGQVVVNGLLLREQRQAVQRAATVVEVDGTAAPPGDLRSHVTARARVTSFSPRRRRAFVRDSLELIDALRHAANGHDGAEAVSAAVVESALAVEGGAEVVVLSGCDRLRDPLERLRVGALARELAKRKVTVVVLTEEMESSDA